MKYKDLGKPVLEELEPDKVNGRFPIAEVEVPSDSGTDEMMFMTSLVVASPNRANKVVLSGEYDGYIDGVSRKVVKASFYDI